MITVKTARRLCGLAFLRSIMERTKIKIPQYAAELMQVLEKAGYVVWCVVGCVRDALMGVTPHDWDMCTSAMPDEMMKVFAGYRTIPTGLKHGTLTVLNRGEMVEITTYRCDGDYLDHRRPESVTFVRDIKSDLERRDFTMNAICLDIRGELYDPFDGEGDIKRGLIRCVGEPRKRFDEDALRIFRAVRFAAKTGFPIDKATLEAAMDMRGLLDEVSAERLYSELKSLLVQPHAGETLRQHREIIAQVIPELRPCFDYRQNNPHHCYDVWTHSVKVTAAVPARPDLRLAALLHDVGKPACFTLDDTGVGHFYGHGEAGEQIARTILDRLRLDRATRERVLTLVRHHDRPILPPEEKTVKRLLGRFGTEGFFALMALKRADNLAQHPDFRGRLAQYDEIEAMARRILDTKQPFCLKDLAVTGTDLLALGYAPGPELGAALQELLRRVMEENLSNTRQVLLKEAEKRRKNHTNPRK